MDKILDLINSGFAGMLPDGKIVDRRERPLALPFQANSLLGVPAPESIEFAKERADPASPKPKRNATTEKIYRRRLERFTKSYKGKCVSQGDVSGRCVGVVAGRGSMIVLKLDTGKAIGLYTWRDVKVI